MINILAARTTVQRLEFELDLLKDQTNDWVAVGTTVQRKTNECQRLHTHIDNLKENLNTLKRSLTPGNSN